ncbi:MAG: aspartate kinase [Sphingobacteriaceae bacterium]
MTHVFKFGGASVKDANGVRNLADIIKTQAPKQLLVVVSAMGKTTNALEELNEAFIAGDSRIASLFETVKTYHRGIVADLFPDSKHPIYDELENVFVEIDWILEEAPHPDADFNYDQLVSIGEILSTKIIAHFVQSIGIPCKWVDARNYIQTDNSYREGEVDWEKTTQLIKQSLPAILSTEIVVTQGFIGNTSENFTTTLGREGSDYSAAIFAYGLQAESLTIWKDVPGVLNADPKLFTDTQKYEQLSYAEALEMTYYGATVIHPKTIKPLQNAGISLLVKPFYAPEEAGTLISEKADSSTLCPAIIVKKNQVLVSISTKDFSFITENHLSELFTTFASLHIKLNTMQISALSFSVCLDYDVKRFQKLQELLADGFKLKYNEALELITIRHFTAEKIKQLSAGRKVYMEQLSRNTAQLVVQ